ncbi:MAG: phosphopantetheine-binding protein [Paracoccaceae bacterium]
MTNNQKITIWTTQDVVEVLRSLAREEELPEHLVTGEITGADTVDSLGIDSLGGVYLIERLEEMTGLLMPDEFLDLDYNLAGIAERLNKFIQDEK